MDSCRKDLVRHKLAADYYTRTRSLVVYWRDSSRSPLEVTGELVLYKYDPVGQSYEIMKKDLADTSETGYDHFIINRDDVSYLDVGKSDAWKEVFADDPVAPVMPIASPLTAGLAIDHNFEELSS